MKTPMKNFLGSPLLSSNMLQTLFPTSIPLIRINLALYLLYDFFLVFRFSFRLLRFFVKDIFWQLLYKLHAVAFCYASAISTSPFSPPSSVCFPPFSSSAFFPLSASPSPSSSFSFPPSWSSFPPSTSAFPPSPSPLFPSSIASWSLFSSVLFPPPCLSSSIASLPTPSTPFPPSSRRTDRPRLRPLPPLRRPRLRLLPFSSAFSSLFLFLSQRLASSA